MIATPPRPPRRLTQRLSAAFVRTAEPGFYCDGHGLNLRVDPSGARQWVQRLVIRGRPRMLGLGGYPLVSLAEARNVAFANRQRARTGEDPLAEKHHGEGVPTVEEAAAEVLEQQRPGWRNAKHALDWPRSLRAYAFPRIGAMPVSEVTTADVLAILTPLWHEKSQTARRVRQRNGAVMKWAVAMGYRPDNPAGDALGQALGRQQTVVQHMRALPHGAVADALATVRASQALVTAKDAFEFLVLTAARSDEVRLVTWDEMDLDAGVWTIPAARMKAKRDHRVPLSGRALAILHDVQRLSDGTGLVFPNPHSSRARSEHNNRMTENRTKPLAIDLFCGAGGMSLGFEQAGFDVLGALDIASWNVSTYNKNFPGSRAHVCDLARATAESLRKLCRLQDRSIDVVFGGPPCQGFSVGGKRDLKDARNVLIHAFARVVRELQPKYFVMENVAGLLHAHSALSLRSFLHSIRLAGTRWLLQSGL